MFDLHCHLLPGIDDGPLDLAAALELARACIDDGVTHAVATPHVFPGRFENRRSNIEEEFAAFAAALREAQLPLQVHCGGEVRLCPEVLALLAIDELPMLGHAQGWHTMLLELPDGLIPLGSDRLVDRLLGQRVRPVIVHPERNRAVMERHDRLRPFVERGCAVQLTAGSLVGGFGSRAQATAQAVIDEGWADAIASDAHNLGGRRPRMREAAAWLTRHYGADAAQRLTGSGPAALCGQAWPAPSAAVEVAAAGVQP